MEVSPTDRTISQGFRQRVITNINNLNSKASMTDEEREQYNGKPVDDGDYTSIYED